MRPFCVKNIKNILSVAFQQSSDGHASRIIACRHNTATGDVAYQATYHIKSVIATALERSRCRDAHCPIPRWVFSARQHLLYA